jgi:glycosyltransferase involved in cell wall biosynthesis
LSFVLLWVRYIRRKPVVWTVHNVRPHGRRNGDALSRLLRLLLSVTVKQLIFLDAETVKVLSRESKRLAEKPSHVVPHGLYPLLEPDRAFFDELSAAVRTGEGTTVFGLIGSLEPYKGPDELVRAFRELEQPDLRLLLVGACRDPGLKHRLVEAASQDKRIILRQQWLSDEQLSASLQAVDWVVIPFRDVLNSGSVLLALQAGRPVIVPNRGNLPALAQEVGRDWISFYRDGELKRELLRASTRRPPSGNPRFQDRAWPSIADQTEAVFNEATGRRR